MARQRLTDGFIKNLKPDEKRNKQYRDSEVPGLAVLVTKRGAKSFVLNYTVGRRERRMTIGAFPTWSTTAARAEAKFLRRDVDRGVDPMATREEIASAPTVIDLWDEYRTKHLPKLSAKNAKDQERAWTRHVLPRLGKIKLKDLASRDVDDLHRDIGRDAPVMANRVVAYLRKALNIAVRNQWVDMNVAKGVQKNREEPRCRYLSKAETERLLDALKVMPNQKAANAIRLLLLTGARRSEVFGAKWSEFDLEVGIWTKPAGRVKTRRDTRVPLSQTAIALLEEMEGKRSSEYLFPTRTGAYIKDINSPWRWLIKNAELKDFRIHDLRHSFASFLVSDGETLETIGRLLGHTQAQTTARYAHLMDDPLKRAVDRAGKIVTGEN
ncbi:tyrosine-type recombinase/integrase [Roseovarius sp.]|uniref:tyrosine-type recombinase/integrase n=1 Tax=Roseovarius sp. TaxID=1486281 RepID=UPI003B5AB426